MNGWNSTLERRTPLRAKKKWEPERKPMKRKPLKKISRSRRGRMAKYREIAAEFLKTHPACGLCLVRDESPRPATEVHHYAGRIGRLLCYVPFFISCCRGCRDWPHENPIEARALGVLAEAGEWNVFPG